MDVQILEVGRKWTTRGGNGMGEDMNRMFGLRSHTVLDEVVHHESIPHTSTNN